jgi:putative addiction module component (TIGR02574 family)
MPLTAEFEETALSFTSQDRAALAMRLMDSLSDEAWEPEDILAEAKRRDEEIESGKVRPLSYEEFMAGLDFKGSKE